MRLFSTPPDAGVRGEDGFYPRGAEVTRLEAFVDAAYAFAISLMVISIDAIPGTIEEFVVALKSIPAFGFSFLLIITFWAGHADWSRRYGLDDRASRRMSLLLVFVVLTFVYPLRMTFAAFFDWATGGWLQSNLALETLDDIRVMFAVFAIGFGSMGALLVLLHVHAWRQRDVIGLDAVERRLTRFVAWRWSLIPLFSLLSLLLNWLLPMTATSAAWMIASPGLIFFVLHLLQFAGDNYQRRLTRRLLEPA